MAIFEDINISAQNLVPDFIKGVNSYTTKGDIPMLGVGLLLLFGASILISSKRGVSFPKAFTLSSFVSMLFAGLMVKIGFFTTTIFYITIVLLIIAIVMLIAEGNEP